MPRIPRPWASADDAPPTEAQHAGDPTPPETQQAPHDAQPSSGDPVAATPPAHEGAPDAAPTVEAGAVAAPATGGPAASAEAGALAGTEPGAEEHTPPETRPRFRERTRMRRRLRYLRRLRELAFRDLGGLVFDLHRFGRERTDLVTQKLETLAGIDRELRALESALGDRQELTELREPGIAACPHCQTLHDTGAQFCPGCGTPLRGADRPGAAVTEPTPVAEPTELGQAPAEQQPTATTPS